MISISKKDKKKIYFHIVSLFPQAFDSYIGESIIARAIRENLISIDFFNPRDFVITPKKAKTDKDAFEEPYKRVDDKPYGGGPGMVMQAEPILKAVETISKKIEKRKDLKKKTLVVFLSPGGEQFDTTIAKKYSKTYTDIIFICGRYEGIDGRVSKILKAKKISVGPYVLTGGELGALIMIDSISRQVEGVLGNFDSREEERVSSHDIYTRPEVLEWKGKMHKVPKVLLSGNHKLIDEWRKGPGKN